jgi:hypothetical protein
MRTGYTVSRSIDFSLKVYQPHMLEAVLDPPATVIVTPSFCPKSSQCIMICFLEAMNRGQVKSEVTSINDKFFAPTTDNMHHSLSGS